MIDINKRVYDHNYTMSELHAHSHYEIYYLTKGTRMFFLENMTRINLQWSLLRQEADVVQPTILASSDVH